jgi:GNAT superfamily N-acetyltransferase
MTSWIVSEDILRQPPAIRDATRDDIPGIVELYVTDELTHKHQLEAEGVPEGYYATFDAIEADARNRLLVAELAGHVVGSFQLTYVPDMMPEGRERAIVENVIVDSAVRGHGIGEAMMRWAIEEARARNCLRVQLTSSKARANAHRFYERLGFQRTHEGFRFDL